MRVATKSTARTLRLWWAKFRNYSIISYVKLMVERLGLVIACLALGIALIGIGYQNIGEGIIIGSLIIGLPMLIVYTSSGKYNIRYEYFEGSLVKFEFPKWKRLLLFGYPSLSQIEAKVAYKYGDEKTQTFWFNAIWKDTGGIVTRVDRPCAKELKVYNDNLEPLGDGIKRPLIGKVTIMIRILLQGTDKDLAFFTVPLVFEEGKLTEEGFIPIP